MADNFDNYGMKVQATASVKMPSVREINKQINALEESIKELRISGKFDDSALKNLTNQLSSLKATVSTANFSPSALNELTSQVEKALGNIKISAKVGQEVGSAITKGMQQNIDSGVVADIKKISDASTSAVVQNEKKKQEAYKATTETVMYHAGVVSKLNKAETNGRFYGSNRGTGYFGTGHYFVDSATKHELDNNSSYSQMPYTSIDISKYNNLFRASTDEIANKLHSFLENLTKFTQGSDTYDVSELFSQFKKVFGETVMDMQEFDAKLEQLKSFMQNSNMSDRSDSVSTQFMKSLGYGGVDTRGTKYADTRYGTVIYDLKEESVLQANITDELQKQGQMLEKINYEKGQVFDQSEDTRIQGILDQQAKSKEIDAEFGKLFDSSKIRQYESELDSVNETLKKNDEIIADCQSGIENADREAQKFAKDMAALGFDTSDEEIAEQADHYRTTFQERIDELQKERPLLEARRQELEENLSAEYKLANTAREQARQIVEERSKEAQESASTTSTIVQNEEKKQQAIQETVNATKETLSEEEKLADAMGKVREKSELARQAQEKRQEVAHSKAINKALDEEYAQKQKLIAQEEKLAQKQAEKVNKIQLLFDNGKGASEYSNRIKSLEQDFVKYGLSADEASKKTETLKNILNGFKVNGDFLPDEQLIAQADKLEQEFKSVKVSLDQAKLSFDKFLQPASDQKIASLMLRIQEFLSKNTAITKEARIQLENYLTELSKGVTVQRWDELNLSLKQTEQSMRVLGRLGKTFKDQWKDAVSSFSTWLSASTAVMKVVSELREATTELRNIDTLLTEISKANDKLTKQELIQIGDNSFDVASKYGKSATDYLSGVQEMSRAGYENAEAMGELSTAAQGAGDMTSDVANSFIVAADKAYKLNGSVEALTETMDGINYITNHNAVNMSELSEGFSIVASTAASFGVEANELTAALGTMAATTQQSGSEVARAFRAILLNIRQVSDEEEGIDAEGLTKYENACNALGVSLKETKNGVLQTRDAMEVLRDLSIEYNKLEENDLRRTELLNSVGGKLRATQLDALLRQWDMYESMLQQYADGSGSMAREAEKTANSWEGASKRLGNTLTDTVENVLSSEFMVTSINFLNTLLTGVNKLTDALGGLGTVGLGIGLTKGIQNAGICV